MSQPYIKYPKPIGVLEDNSNDHKSLLKMQNHHIKYTTKKNTKLLKFPNSTLNFSSPTLQTENLKRFFAPQYCGYYLHQKISSSLNKTIKPHILYPHINKI